MSRFKHEMFSVLQYAMDFRTISKESLKLITKWKASYFTHPASYYPVPQSSTYPASRVSFRIFLEKSGRLCSYDMERAAVKRSAMKRSAMKTALRTLMKKLEKRRWQLNRLSLWNKKEMIFFAIHEMKNTRSPIHLFIVIDLFVTSHVMKCKTRKKITC